MNVGIPRATFGSNKSEINVTKVKVELGSLKRKKKKKLQRLSRHLHVRIKEQLYLTQLTTQVLGAFSTD